MTYRTELEKRLKLLDLQSPPNTNSDEISLNRAKVGTNPKNAQPPSKMTPTDSRNVIYLNYCRTQKGHVECKTRANEGEDENQNSCEIHFIPRRHHFADLTD